MENKDYLSSKVCQIKGELLQLKCNCDALYYAHGISEEDHVYVINCLDSVEDKVLSRLQ